jgi:hypothetical protein
MLMLNLSKIKLLIAFAIGYVAGAAAGRQRYQTIKAGAQKVAEDPRVQAAAKKAGETLADKAPVVAEAIKNKTTAADSAVADKMTSGDEPDPDGAPARANGSVPLS